MRQFIIAVLLLFAVTAYAEITLIDNIKPKNDAFNVITDLSLIGDATNDTSCDRNSNGVIDYADTAAYATAGGDTVTAYRAAINDSLQANWATFIADQNDTVTAYRAAINDSLQANWATFIADDTVTAYRAAIHDSLNANWATFIADDTVTSYRAAIQDSLIKIWQRVEYYIVNALRAHGNPSGSEDSVEASLPGYDSDTSWLFIYRDSSYGTDETDTVWLDFGALPYGVTKCDSLILTYRSSSATTTTSCIANIRLYLDGVPQWEHTTDEASTTNERLGLYPNDADFDAGEVPALQIIFEGDVNAWIKVVSAYLFCSGG